jgi:hypothetical protein
VFQVHTDGRIVEFKPSSQGLHYHDISDPSSNVELMLIDTVGETLKDIPGKVLRGPEKPNAFKE